LARARIWPFSEARHRETNVGFREAAIQNGLLHSRGHHVKETWQGRRKKY